MPNGNWNDEVRNSLVAGLTATYHPFAKGNLTVGGLQTSTEVSNVGYSGSYHVIESVTLNNPLNGRLRDAKLDLTGQVANNSSWLVNYKWQGSDDNSAWVDLCTAKTTTTSTNAYAHVGVAGYFSPVSGFLISGDVFYIRMVALTALSGVNYSYGRTTNSGYVTLSYY